VCFALAGGRGGAGLALFCFAERAALGFALLAEATPLVPDSSAINATPSSTRAGTAMKIRNKFPRGTPICANYNRTKVPDSRPREKHVNRLLLFSQCWKASSTVNPLRQPYAKGRRTLPPLFFLHMQSSATGTATISRRQNRWLAHETARADVSAVWQERPPVASRSRFFSFSLRPQLPIRPDRR